MRFQWKARLHGKLVSMVSSFSRLLCGWLCGSVIVAFMLHLVIMQPMSVKFFSWLFAIFMIAKLLSRRFIRLEQMFYCNFLFNVFIFCLIRQNVMFLSFVMELVSGLVSSE